VARKTVDFGSGIKAGQVAYVVDKNIVYFHQTDGVYSSINAEELIVEAIAQKEGINWKEYKWVDIQTKPRYSENAQDELVFTESTTPDVLEWKATVVPNEVIKIIF
jgi:hypothetical protein